METYFKEQMDYIFFFYGLSFILLAAVCQLLRREKHELLPWGWLTCFGLIHGLNEWADMVAFWQDFPAFKLARWTLMFASFVALLEFGRLGVKQIAGRGPGRWIHLPLLALVICGGFLGTTELNSCTRYAYGFVGGLWSAIALYLAAGKAQAQKTLLKCASIALALYAAVSGAVVPKVSFFPATLVNHESFQATMGFPVQLLRGLLAVALAAVLWFYARQYGLYIAEKKMHSRQNLLTNLTAACLFLTLVAGYFLTNVFGNTALERVKHDSINMTAQLKEIISDHMKEVQHMAQAITGSRRVTAFFVGRNAETQADVDQLVDWFSSSLDDSIFYFMNEQGDVIASSNRNRDDSFLGKNFAFRPYFQEAMKGSVGSYFALGTIHKERGYYASYPVYNKDKRIIGVSVCKKNFQEIENFFRGYPYMFFIDPNGIVFISSREDMVLHSLWKLSDAEQKTIIDSRQFGKGPFEPMLKDRIKDDTQCKLDGEAHYVSLHDTIMPGWRIANFWSMKSVFIYRYTGIGFTLLFCLVFLGVFVVWNSILYASAQIAVSEERYRGLVEGSPNWISLCDSQGVVLSINRGGADAVGLSDTEILGQRLSSLMPESQREKFDAAIQQVSGGVKQNLLGYYQGKDGRVTIWQIVLIPIGVVTGARNRFILIANDITEKQQSIEKLRQSNMEEEIINSLLHISLLNIPFKEKLKQVLEKLYSTPWLPVLPKGAIFLANETKTELEMVVEKNLPQPLLHICKNVPFGTCLCGLAAQKGEIIFSDHIDECHTHRFDGMTPHGHYIVPLKSTDGLLGVLDLYLNHGHKRDEKEIVFLVSAANIIVNIIQRHRADEALAALRHKLELILDNAGEGIIGLDKHGKHMFINKTASSLLGYTFEELFDRTSHDLWHHTRADGSPYPAKECPILRSLSEARVFVGENEFFRKKDGSGFPVSFISTPIFEKQELVGCVVIFRDVTEKKRMEAQLMLSEKMASVGNLAAGVAHEINNPLSAVLGFAQLLSFRVTDSEIKKDLENIMAGALRCKKIIDSLVKYSRTGRTSKAVCGLNEILHDTVEIVSDIMKGDNITFELTPEKNLPHTFAAPGQIQQVLMHLINNAKDSIVETGNPGKIVVATYVSGDMVCLSVTDTGTGISPENKNRVFDPFFTTKEVGKGTGLGLTTSYEIMVEHNGSLRLVNGEPGNTTFELSLPIKR